MINSMELTEKKIIITGASSGLGQETAIMLSKLGAKVILIARNEERLQETLAKTEGVGHDYFAFDLRCIEKIDNLISEIVLKHGKLDGLVHCAGVSSKRPLKMLNYESLHDVMLINFYSFVELVRVYANKKNNNGGSIVAMSSVASRKGDKSHMAYCASKAALDSAIRVMAAELSAKNIRVNSVVAGLVRTQMYESSVLQSGQKAVNENVLSHQYLGLGEPSDISGAIAYLLSDAAKWITGTGMVVDGGYLA